MVFWRPIARQRRSIEIENLYQDMKFGFNNCGILSNQCAGFLNKNVMNKASGITRLVVVRVLLLF